jgi:hypothetical protein
MIPNKNFHCLLKISGQDNCGMFIADGITNGYTLKNLPSSVESLRGEQYDRIDASNQRDANKK